MGFVSLALLSSVCCVPQSSWAWSCSRGLCITRHCFNGECTERVTSSRTEGRRETDDIGRTETTPRYSSSTNSGRNQNRDYERKQSAETGSNDPNGDNGISREIIKNGETRLNDAKNPYSNAQTIGTYVYL